RDAARKADKALPVAVGGPCGGYVRKRQSKADKQKRRPEQFGELVSALYEHEHWLDDMRHHRVFCDEAPRNGSPLAKARAVSTTYFPEFDKRISELESVAYAYELWMAKAAQAPRREDRDSF
ncbi:MAG: hypothetical protein ABSA62_04640, partial [Methyloceanibacter sp.]